MSYTMDLDHISYIADEAGRRRVAVVPIVLWEQIASAIETRQLLDNPVMRRRLLEAAHRTDASPLEEGLERLGVSEREFDDEVD